LASTNRSAIGFERLREFPHDNAPHHPEVESFPHHKHVEKTVMASERPALRDLLVEIQRLLDKR
jgi:hypothetical protein